MRWCLLCVLVAWLAVSAGFVARTRAETPEATELYDRVLAEAISAFKARHWSRARDLFQRAHEMSPSARTLRGIGVTAFEGGEYVAAIHALEAALVHPQKQLPPDLREGTRVLIEQARARVGVVTVALTPEDADVRCDGEGLTRENDGSLLLDPGPHVLSFSAPGFVAQEHGLNISGKDRQSLLVALEPEPPKLAASPSLPSEDARKAKAPSALASLAPPAIALMTLPREQPPTASAPPPAPLLNARGRRVLAYGTLAVTLAAIGTSAALFLRSTQLNNELHEWCPDPGGVCPAEYIEPANDRKDKIGRYQRAFGTTIGLSVGAGLASITLWTLEHVERRRERRARRASH